jgi:hypothetical protein
MDGISTDPLTEMNEGVNLLDDDIGRPTGWFQTLQELHGEAGRGVLTTSSEVIVRMLLRKHQYTSS